MTTINPYRRGSLFNAMMSDPFEAFFGASPAAKPESGLMRTDIKETDLAYEVAIDLPGFAKDQVQLELEDDYLTIQAETASEENETEGTFVRKERFTGKCSRRFYVGEDIEQDDIKAAFVDGVLRITVPKKQPKPQTDSKRLISIS